MCTHMHALHVEQMHYVSSKKLHFMLTVFAWTMHYVDFAVLIIGILQLNNVSFRDIPLLNSSPFCAYRDPIISTMK